MNQAVLTSARAQQAEIRRADAARTCHHCGAPLPPVPVRASIDGETRDFCCAGCSAVAQVIAEGGLCAYYDKRDATGLPALQDAEIARLREQWQALDDRDFLAAFATDLGGGAWRTLVAVEGIHCGACVWLIERHLLSIPGVRVAAVNYATRRVLLEWDDNRVHLGVLLEALARIGYKPAPNVRHANEAQQRRASRLAILRTLVAWLAMMQVMMLAWPSYVDPQGLSAAERAIFHWASLSITLPTLLFSGWTFIAGSARDWRMRRLGMDVPVVLGLWGAFFASVASVARGTGPVYFDSVTMFLALLLTARLVETGLRHRSTNAADSLLEQLPAAVRRRMASGGWETVAITRVRAGDVVQVPSASLVAVDGTVLEGVSHAGEALLTGESTPVRKAVGSRVLAGSMNVDSPLLVRTEAAGQGTRIAQMVALMNGALVHKPQAARLADVAARGFTVVLLGVASATALLWWWLDAARIVPAVIAVLVVSCPCALSLAVPAALAAATARLSRAGVLVARGHALDVVAAADTWLFDKTGTITTGQAEQVQVVWLQPGLTAARAIAMAAALEQGVQHPLAQALTAEAKALGLQLSEVSNQQVTQGEGVRGEINGQLLRFGQPQSTPGQGDASDAESLAADATLLELSRDGVSLALIAVAERLRPGASEAVDWLKANGARLELLSGDHLDSAQRWARRVGIPTAHGGMLPEAKLARVQAMQRDGMRVAMVGDGVNDAPTLAAADVSVSFASAAPIARAGADVVLAFDDMRALPLLVRMSRQARCVMRQNLAWAVVYNLVFVPLAAAGLVTPLWAAVGMSVSSLLVVLNSARLAWFDKVKV
jgi:Cu2+-exporting ATPase